MNRELLSGICVIVAIALGFFLGQGPARPRESGIKTRRVLYYVDPMHPSYKSDKPGIAPDCGMQLEPVYAEDIKSEPARSSLTHLPAGAVSIDGPTQQLLGIRLATVERSSATHVVRVVGRIVPEDTRVYRINSGVDGFIR